jgi:hypothetical protein
MLPNLLIIGAQKSGTTSLHYYLSHHPQISMSREKELNFFSEKHNWGKGVEWYKRQFSTPTPIRGEASPSYTHYPVFEGVPQRIRDLLPDVKLIYIVRDPIERIISNWVHIYAARIENRPLHEVLDVLEGNPLVTRSMYYLQLEQYLSLFKPDQLLVIDHASLHEDRRVVLRKIFKFLCVDETFDSPIFDRLKHESTQKRRTIQTAANLIKHMTFLNRLPTNYRSFIIRYAFYPVSKPVLRPTISPAQFQTLTDFLRDDVNKLRAFTGLALESWSV